MPCAVPLLTEPLFRLHSCFFRSGDLIILATDDANVRPNQYGMSYNDERERTLMTNVRPNIRSFRHTRAHPQVMHEFSETEAMIALCNLQGSRFGYALNNGAIGTYDGPERSWRAKMKARPVEIRGFDMTMDGVQEMVTAWSNGSVVRNVLCIILCVCAVCCVGVWVSSKYFPCP